MLPGIEGDASGFVLRFGAGEPVARTDVPFRHASASPLASNSEIADCRIDRAIRTRETGMGCAFAMRSRPSSSSSLWMMMDMVRFIRV